MERWKWSYSMRICLWLKSNFIVLTARSVKWPIYLLVLPCATIVSIESNIKTFSLIAGLIRKMNTKEDIDKIVQLL